MPLLPNIFLKKCTERARSAINRALSSSSDEATATDLLYALTAERGSLAANILADHPSLVESVKRRWLRQHRRKKTKSPLLSKQLKQVMTRAMALACEHRTAYIGTEHLLGALIAEGIFSTLIETKKAEVLTQELQRQTVSLISSSRQFPNLTLVNELLSGDSSPLTAPVGSERKQPKRREPRRSLTRPKSAGLGDRQAAGALEYFCEDLIGKAAAGELDPLIGRQEEVARLLSILSRRTKNNPLLIGEAGVGKTAIVQGLAQQIQSGTVPEHLLDRRLLVLDLGLLVAGTVFRGEFESRLKDVIQEAVEEEAILFIDEIHTIIGAGAAQGSLDAANLLKPAIASGELQLVGATTIDEYRRSIEKDPALERRFQPLLIREPSAEETITILKGLRPRFENYHRVKISDEVIRRTVVLASRFLHERYFPDKAIDVLDEAAARLRSSEILPAGRGRAFKLKEALFKATEEKERAIRADQYDQALGYKVEEERIKGELAGLQSQGPDSFQKEGPLFCLEPSHIEAVVSQMAGVGLPRVSEKETERLVKIGRRLREQIIGQDKAIQAVAAALRRARSGIKEDRRPVGSFLFLGPSGVGKTELARVLARVWFEDPTALLKLDMSEFSESHTVSKFLGSPPGYIGYDDSATILEAVRRRPAALILFDEIEKAHPRVQNLLLQILEDGRLSDAKGTPVTFEHSIIVLTSNIGSGEFAKHRKLGFGVPDQKRRLGDSRDTRLSVFKELRSRLAPELLSRLETIVIFNPLGLKEIQKITELELKRLQDRLRERGWTLLSDKTALKYLAERARDSRKGARQVRATIRQLVEDPLAQKIISGELEAIRRIKLEATKKSLQWKFLKR